MKQAHFEDDPFHQWDPKYPRDYQFIDHDVSPHDANSSQPCRPPSRDDPLETEADNE